MKRFWYWTVWISVFVLCVVGVAGTHADPGNLLLKTDPLDESQLTHLPSGVMVLARLNGRTGPYALLLTDRTGQSWLDANHIPNTLLDAGSIGTDIYLVTWMHLSSPEARPGHGQVLVDDGYQFVLLATSIEADKLSQSGFAVVRLQPGQTSPNRAPATIPADVDADPFIGAILDQVQPAAATKHVGDLSGAWAVTIDDAPYTIQTRYTYSGVPLAKAITFVGEQLAGWGLNVTYHQWNGSTYRNVIAELPGTTNPEQIVIICAHLDSTSPSATTSAPGADDNASGTASVLLAAELFSRYQWDKTLRFALWTGEEQGLLGSDVYAAEAATNGEQIVGVVNLDMIGYDSDAQPILDLHARSWLPESVNLANLFADVIAEYNLDLQPAILIDNFLGNYSDNKSFWDESYAAILAIEDYDDFTPYYHTTSDQLNTLNATFLNQSVKAALGTTAHLSGGPLRGEVHGEVSEAGVGTLISGADLIFEHPVHQPVTAVTNASGVYTVTLPTGAYTLTVTAAPFTTATIVPVSIGNGMVKDLDVQLSGSGQLSGVVTNLTTTTPISTAQINLIRHTGAIYTTTTDFSGRYTITLPSGNYTMTTSAPGYWTRHHFALPVTAESMQVLDVGLQAVIEPTFRSVLPAILVDSP